MAPQALRALVSRLRGPHRGTPGESLACRHLAGKGFAILARNYRCRSGEVDVIARHGEATVFVEVKERHGASHGAGCDSVTFGKRRRIVRAARLYAAAHGLDETPLRFDGVSIDWTQGGRPVIRHDQGAFNVDGS
ncbi:MAG: YraN family protein [Acidobacteria bacterium]|nr:MAG: YraN family protein [Acidobacteriota bacterium]